MRTITLVCSLAGRTYNSSRGPEWCRILNRAGFLNEVREALQWQSLEKRLSSSNISWTWRFILPWIRVEAIDLPNASATGFALRCLQTAQSVMLNGVFYTAFAVGRLRGRDRPRRWLNAPEQKHKRV